MKTNWKTRLEQIQDSALAIWRRYWLLRWTVANMLAWSLALVAAVLLLQLMGLWGAILGGAVAGAIAAFIQSSTLVQIKSWTVSRKRWIIWGAVGGALATIPVYLLGFVALFHAQIGLTMMGAMFGGIIGCVQYHLLQDDYHDAALWWVLASIIGGMLCAPLTFTTALILPVIGSLGPVVFGLVTGWAIITMNRQPAE
ncbi:MAG: hypothetical protein Q9P44_15120 [Anaerolineae bacterium]|nr:hypothetical protein [Anaerolineae bacterium]